MNEKMSMEKWWSNTDRANQICRI